MTTARTSGWGRGSTVTKKTGPKFKIVLAAWKAADELAALVGQEGQPYGKCPLHLALSEALPEVAGERSKYVNALALTTTDSGTIFRGEWRTREQAAKRVARRRWRTRDHLWASYTAILKALDYTKAKTTTTTTEASGLTTKETEMTTTTWTRPKITTKTTNAALIEHVRQAEDRIKALGIDTALGEREEKTLQRVAHKLQTLKKDLRSLLTALCDRIAKQEAEASKNDQQDWPCAAPQSLGDEAAWQSFAATEGVVDQAKRVLASEGGGHFHGAAKLIAEKVMELAKQEEEAPALVTPINTTVYRASPEGEWISTERASCEECGAEGWRGDFPDQGGIVHYEGKLTCDPCWDSSQEKGTSGGVCPNCETWQSDPGADCLHCASLQEEVRVCEEYALGRATVNYCPDCRADVTGHKRELMLENGTKCHGCGYTVGQEPLPLEPLLPKVGPMMRISEAAREAAQRVEEETPSNPPSEQEELAGRLATTLETLLPGDPWEDDEVGKALDAKRDAWVAESKRKAQAATTTAPPAAKTKAKAKAAPKAKAKAKGAPKRLLVQDDPQEAYAPHLETKARVYFMIDPSGSTTVTSTGITYKTPRKAGVAAGVWPVDRLQTWRILRYTGHNGEERLVDELRTTPNGYTLSKKAKKA